MDIPCLPMITHTIYLYCIPSQNKTKSKWQFKESAKASFFLILKKKTLHATHLLKLLDKICKYEMDQVSIAEDTERTPLCPKIHRRTRWNHYTPLNFAEVGCIIITSNGSWCQGIKGKCPAQFMSHCYGISFVEYVFESHYLSHHYDQNCV